MGGGGTLLGTNLFDSIDSIDSNMVRMVVRGAKEMNGRVKRANCSLATIQGKSIEEEEEEEVK